MIANVCEFAADWTSQSFAPDDGDMTNEEDPRSDWPFGPFLTSAVRRSGLSKRRIATAAQISEGRLRQLETGYQKSGGIRIPISTTVNTVTNLAAVLEFDIYEGLRLAGLQEAIPDEATRFELDEHWREDRLPPVNPDLARYSVNDLLGEVQARYDRLEIPKRGHLSQWVSTVSGGEIDPTRRLVATDEEVDAMSPRGRAQYRAEVEAMLDRIDAHKTGRDVTELSHRRPTVDDLKGLPSAAEPPRQDRGGEGDSAGDGQDT